MSRATARELGLAVGDRLAVRAAGIRRELTVVGLLDPGDPASARALDGLLVTDISSAQEIFGAAGRLGRIDLIAPDDAAGRALLERIARALPPGAELVTSGARAGTTAQMIRAFQWNLTALSLLALVVGMFLIYQTMTFSVVQRRPLIGALRALGVTRAEIFALVMSEAALIGVVGTTAGLALGWVLARGLLGLVTRTINDLYFVLSVRDVALEPLVLAKGVLLGLGATLAAALAPAFEATGAPPRVVMSRGALETGARRLVPRVTWLGFGLLAAGALILALPGGIAGGFAGSVRADDRLGARRARRRARAAAAAPSRRDRGLRHARPARHPRHRRRVLPDLGRHRRADDRGVGRHRRRDHDRELSRGGGELARGHPARRRLRLGPEPGGEPAGRGARARAGRAPRRHARGGARGHVARRPRVRLRRRGAGGGARRRSRAAAALALPRGELGGHLEPARRGRGRRCGDRVRALRQSSRRSRGRRGPSSHRPGRPRLPGRRRVLRLRLERGRGGDEPADLRPALGRSEGLGRRHRGRARGGSR